jgi:hypothetical protein
MDQAAYDLNEWAKSQGRRAALFIDSIQRVWSDKSKGLGDDASPRQVVCANVLSLRGIADKYRMLLVATSQANRASYRTEESVNKYSAMSAGSETSDIEFCAQTQIMLTAPKDCPDVIHCEVVKNRKGDTGEYWLRLDREHHTLSECGDPSENPEVVAKGEEKRRASVRGKVSRDARDVAEIVGHHPNGIGDDALRAAVKLAGLTMGKDRLAAAKELLRADGYRGEKLVDLGKGEDRAKRIWVMRSTAPEASHDDSRD